MNGDFAHGKSTKSSRHQLISGISPAPDLGRLFGGRFRRALEQLPLLLFVFLHCFLFFLVRFPLSLLLSLFLRLLVFVECLLLLLGQLLVLAIIFRGRALGFSWYRPSSAEED